MNILSLHLPVTSSPEDVLMVQSPLKPHADGEIRNLSEQNCNYKNWIPEDLMYLIKNQDQ